MLFFNMTDRHHTSTTRWQHSWRGSCLSDGSAGRVHFLASAISKSDLPRLFPVGLCERWGLRSENAYKTEELEGSKTNSDCKNWSAFIARSQISSWCVQGNKCSIYWTFIENEKNLLSCSLQWFEFSSYVTITFLSINSYNRSHHL